MLARREKDSLDWNKRSVHMYMILYSISTAPTADKLMVKDLISTQVA
jgi:hypothetical protein